MSAGRMYRIKSLSAFMLIILGAMIFSMISACKSETAVTPTNGIITQIQVVNLSPDMGGLYLYSNFIRQNAFLSPYKYGTPSGYVSVLNTKTPFQLQTRENVQYFNYTSSLVLNNRYTVFTTGLVTEKTWATILTTDSDAVPSTGHGKVRFVNASARAINLDVTANGTTAFSNQPFKGVSKYIELPAGVYSFRLYNTGNTDVLKELTKITIQDGKLYTLYSQGIFQRSDSAAFTAGIITNR